ncbi:SH3 domain-containing protein [Streptomyces rubradiris]|uniref:SH3b domain-containing protein n=1 Tax=Streptomyces rubradiris TaxID=285531 RepID=A0ABQ3RA70_STRRR|nr:SH3 domain-containing protein [Streptomyces rubradiris]GHH25841.1 hypothetical protein GCM10018792_65490 [Streptomyces rubradiris]GHI52754.1 hypothetical protein Srubr_26000 [Streptomyces rubradiris]
MKQTAAVSAATLTLAGGAFALAPSASAVGTSACTDGQSFINFPFRGHLNTGSVNLRTSPSTKSSSKGLLARKTSVDILCWKGKVPTSWDYVKVASGTHKGTYGWVYDKYVDWK